MNTSDIEGAWADYKPRHKRLTGNKRNPLDVSDIVKTGFVTKRVSDPLNPVHVIHGQVQRLDETSRPRAVPPAHNGIDFQHTCHDILGSSPGWKSKGISTSSRRGYRETNKLSDIQGSTADTYKPYPHTNRHTNPLAPVYTNLDGMPIINDFSSNPIPSRCDEPSLMLVPETIEGKQEEISMLREEVARLRVQTNANNNNNNDRSVVSALPPLATSLSGSLPMSAEDGIVGSSRSSMASKPKARSARDIQYRGPSPRQEVLIEGQRSSRSNSLSTVESRREKEQLKLDIEAIKNLQ